MRLVIGIPCYRDVPGEVLEDYMRFAFYLGRRTDLECFLSIKTKSEQFRARNAIVEAAMQMSADYLLMIDDDMVIDWEGLQSPNSRYGFISTLIDHLESDPKAGICGVKYFQRGGECRPVIMKRGKDGGYYWMSDDEIKPGLQEVDVAGGGCFLGKMAMYHKLPQPWFEPELQIGTDIQICKKASEAGFKVLVDADIELGHVKSTREIVTSKNRNRHYSDYCLKQGINADWAKNSAMNLYRLDVEEYTGKSLEALSSIPYDIQDAKQIADLDDYYKTRGLGQLARQASFHCHPGMINQMEVIHNMIDTNMDGYGVDYGCGSAPVGFELALRGHQMDFVDIDGAYAYEFTKWRAKKRGINAGFSLGGPYDYALMLDCIEHLKDWAFHVKQVIDRLKPKGCLITNFFQNKDFDNLEHISMDHDAVRQFLRESGLYPINDIVWINGVAKA